ncbi:uncharacterized protein K452DRAFT_268256 [Aplosporella prunicola CBS 121167]|uniref:Uncharacterized protein n=1 Tax=Aplosporella prunicola CBS 121167 TaxID=1176127 RepID=A0A6A6BI54_9PEZI|nr:uncharacterized protein K452DRAFT_268256 [Aplosporella prunicola CBS 121167]KAF2143829.1 hypothetical protein K452DRAFT_268256 [Aplosporella prunicola CBS 121167]
MSPFEDDATLHTHHRHSDPVDSSTILPQRSSSPASSITSSISSLPYRRSNATLSSLFASTSTLRPSSPTSGTATPTAPLVAGSVFSPPPRNGTSSPRSPHFAGGGSDESRILILRSFVPHVAVLASADTEEMCRLKGFPGGFLELLRPYGELVQGKVTIRDSVGASRSWDDFGIRFVGLKDGLGVRPFTPRQSSDTRPGSVNEKRAPGVPSQTFARVGGDVGAIEDAVDKHLLYAEMQLGNTVTDYFNSKRASGEMANSSSPFYRLYLRRLLSGLPMTPHETFSHPVACVIAISSRSPSPIEELRRLYGGTNQGEQRLPQWVNNDYLRYYVLVHDEDHDDIAKSTALYEQMKRHFGLHCHLLRLRSTQCVSSDDDAVRLPMCDWLSASEELAEIQKRENLEDVEDPTPCLFESDATALRTFIRELVTQSVVPTMERLTVTWNEQVASRRRGISGRFMSLSKRWTGFGTSSRHSGALQGGSGSNYDSLQGFYRPDTPEAIMRKLADYAFMLRDYRLASSTYEILRSDFNNDKAWKYYAGANEMTVIATLMTPTHVSSKTRSENLDQMLETASYSYISRCASPYHALRTLALGLELLKLRGSSASEDAARWAARILELRLVGPIGHALFTERMGACYASIQGIGTMQWGVRRRKAGLWAVLAADAWVRMEKSVQAEKCLDESAALYGTRAGAGEDDGESSSARGPIDEIEEHKDFLLDPRRPRSIDFQGMRRFLIELRQSVLATRLAAQGYGDADADADTDDLPPSASMAAAPSSAATAPPGASAAAAAHPTLEPVDEVSETLDVTPMGGGRPHRRSLMGGGPAPFAQLGENALSPMRSREEEPPLMVLEDTKGRGGFE